MTVCGTGLGDVTLPGDPDLNTGTLSVSARIGGALVSWSYPSFNAHALAFVEIYRSTGNTFGSAVKHKIGTGDSYFDVIETESSVTYYYWIKMVSINGTVGNVIGPASATVTGWGGHLLGSLQGKVPFSALSPELQTTLGELNSVSDYLNTEINNRESGDLALAGVLGTFESALATLDSTLVAEIIARNASYGTMLNSIEQLEFDGTNTIMGLEALTIVTGTQATEILGLSEFLDTVNATLGAQGSEILSLDTKSKDQASSISGLITVNNAQASLILDIQTTTATQATQLNTLQTTVGNQGSSITALDTTTKDQALSLSSLNTQAAGFQASINTLNTTTATQASSISTLTTKSDTNAATISTVSGTVAGLSAEYNVKLDVNGYVTGFSQYNKGAGANGFLVHTDFFAVGRPGQSNNYPFTVGTVNGVTSITLNASTFIADAAIDTVKIGSAAVTTLKIGAEQVVVPRSAYADNEVLLTPLFVAIGDVTINWSNNSSEVPNSISILLATTIKYAAGVAVPDTVEFQLTSNHTSPSPVAFYNYRASIDGNTLDYVSASFQILMPTLNKAGNIHYVLSARTLTTTNVYSITNRAATFIGAKR